VKQNTKEKEVFEEGMQSSTEVQILIVMQPSAMEIDMNALSSIEVKRCATIMDKATLLDKGIHVPNPN
jgi:helix-turn-helix protein